MNILIIYEHLSHVKALCSQLSAEPQFDNRRHLIGYMVKKNNNYLLSSCVGCMHLLNTLHIISKHFKFECCLRLGTCGIINPALKLGQFSLIDYCTNKDALSAKYYSNISPEANQSLKEKFCQLIPNISRSHTKDLIWEVPEQHADTVDMESSALYCYCNYNNIKALSISLHRDNEANCLSPELVLNKIQKLTMEIIADFENYKEV